MTQSLLSFSDLLVDHESFKVLVSEWKQQQILSEQIQQLLPAGCQKKVKLGCVKKGIVYLLAENNSVATQCRYQLSTLLSQLRKLPGGAGLGSLQIRVDAEAFMEGQLLRVHHKQSVSSSVLEELIRSYANQASSEKQRAACEAWIENLKRL